MRTLTDVHTAAPAEPPTAEELREKWPGRQKYFVSTLPDWRESGAAQNPKLLLFHPSVKFPESLTVPRVLPPACLVKSRVSAAVHREMNSSLRLMATHRRTPAHAATSCSDWPMKSPDLELIEKLGSIVKRSLTI